MPCCWSSDLGVKGSRLQLPRQHPFQLRGWGDHACKVKGEDEGYPTEGYPSLSLQARLQLKCCEVLMAYDGKELPSRDPGWTAMIWEPRVCSAASVSLPTPPKKIIIKEEERKNLVGLGSSLSTLTGKVNNITNWDYSPEIQNNQEKLSGLFSGWNSNADLPHRYLS